MAKLEGMHRLTIAQSYSDQSWNDHKADSTKSQDAGGKGESLKAPYAA